MTSPLKSSVAADEILENSILAKFPEAVRQSLIQDAVRLVIPAGTILYYEQDEPRCGLVLSGLIRVYMSSPDAREITVRYARVGEMLGIAAIVGGPAPVNVQILTDATLLMFSVRTLQTSGQSIPHVGWLLAQEVTQRLYETLEALAVNVFGSLRQRIILHLFDLAASRQQGGKLVAQVTQQELADAVGSVRPVIARIIRDLRTEGLITTSSAGIVLRKPDDLYMETWLRDV
jgi:CRP/FNR family transcriptional regulator, cyclic AMP receptor protein